LLNELSKNSIKSVYKTITNFQKKEELYIWLIIKSFGKIYFLFIEKLNKEPLLAGLTKRFLKFQIKRQVS